MNLPHPTTATAARADTTPRLFVLNLSAGSVLSMTPDGKDQQVIASRCHMPDGVAVDVDAGRVYWTNMGVPDVDDGTIERADLDGSNRVTIVPQGVTHTPKQIHLETESGKLYWSDREGMRVMRCNLDGSAVETLVVTGDPKADRGDQTRWCVGIAIDPQAGEIYWTQKGSDNAGVGRILRAGIELPPGQTAANRSDVEVWIDRLPEPIDLEIDHEQRLLYWTDRGDPPNGNTVNRASLDSPPGKARPEIVLTHLMEGIGLALDAPGERMFVTDLGGSVYVAGLDGSQGHPILFAQGNLSGVAYAELPTAKA
ncbi:MAG: 3-hydroxyacyl-CoA dehydrogenase [Phenylobacterium sp.]|nr:MAG: 3-hydroxyacyl-CoA dehydrogenase [Phenylobacterium sp.]